MNDKNIPKRKVYGAEFNGLNYLYFSTPATPSKTEPEKEVNEMGELTLESIFNFGKHKGKQVEDVIEDHPNYIAWMVENEVRDFDEEAMELIAKKGIA